MAHPYGILLRDKPRVQFVKGYVGQGTSKDQESHPFKSGEEIRSGMIASKYYVTANSRYEWVAGLIAGAVPYVILQDYDDADVIGSGGVLTGIPLSSEIVYRTPWYTLGTEANWDEDAAVSAVARTPSDAWATALAAGCGNVKIAASTEQIIGVLSGGHINTLLDVAAENSNVTKTSGKVLVAQITAQCAIGNLKA